MKLYKAAQSLARLACCEAAFSKNLTENHGTETPHWALYVKPLPMVVAPKPSQLGNPWFGVIIPLSPFQSK